MASPRRRRYFLVAALGSAFIWALALAVVWLVPRVWAVDYTLILPSSDPDGRVSLNEVGQAYATSRSTYDGKSLDPRVNYRQIMMSDDVLDAAAKLAEVPLARFGTPRIKLIDQSSVMEVEVRGGSAKGALRKARRCTMHSPRAWSPCAPTKPASATRPSSRPFSTRATASRGRSKTC